MWVSRHGAGLFPSASPSGPHVVGSQQAHVPRSNCDLGGQGDTRTQSGPLITVTGLEVALFSFPQSQFFASLGGGGGGRHRAPGLEVTQKTRFFA